MEPRAVKDGSDVTQWSARLQLSVAWPLRRVRRESGRWLPRSRERYDHALIGAPRPPRGRRLLPRKIRVLNTCGWAADGEISALLQRGVAAVEIADGAVDLHADRMARIIGLGARRYAREQHADRNQHEASAAHLSATNSPASARADDSDRRRDRRFARRNKDWRCRWGPGPTNSPDTARKCRTCSCWGPAIHRPSGRMHAWRQKRARACLRSARV